MAGKQSSITERALHQAIAFLRTTGYTYLIQDADGNEVANTIPRGKYNKTGMQYKPHFKPFIDALNGEGVVDIHIPDEYDPIKYRGALAGYLHSEFGSGGYITSLNTETRTVSVIVVGGDDSVHPVEAEPEVLGQVKQAAADKGTITVQVDEPKPRTGSPMRRAPAPLNPVLPSEIVEALRVPDFSKD